MNLDNQERIRALDPENMLAAIDGLPDQLRNAWSLGQEFPLPDVKEIRQVLVGGMGGSAIGGDLLAAYVRPLMKVPLIIWRDYDLPAYASGLETLVITSSHSGNTEETLSAFKRGGEVGTRRLAISTGGALASRAVDEGVPLWQFEHAGQPRAAVGFSFGLLLAALTRLGLIPDQAKPIDEAVAAMREQQEYLKVDVPAAHNPAKRMAGQLMDRLPTVIGSGLLAPVARRWRTQIAELAKSLAQFEELPEADHNMVAGVLQPESQFPATMFIFLQTSMDHPRNLLRIEATRKVLMLEGLGTDVIEARGTNRLAQQWTCLHFGDYTAFYLAMAYGIDPTPVMAIEGLKDILRQAKEEEKI
jgi:glucose/mannose-6-phosphate isomerase